MCVKKIPKEVVLDTRRCTNALFSDFLSVALGLDLGRMCGCSFLGESCLGTFFKEKIEPIQFVLVSLFYMFSSIIWIVREVAYSRVGGDSKGFLEDYDWDNNRNFMNCVAAQMVFNSVLIVLLVSILFGWFSCCRYNGANKLRYFKTWAWPTAGREASFILTILVFLAFIVIESCVAGVEKNRWYTMQVVLNVTGYLFQILYWGTFVKPARWGVGEKGLFQSEKWRDIWLAFNVFLVLGLFIVIIAMNVQFESNSTTQTAGFWQYSTSVLENLLISLCLQLALRFWSARELKMDWWDSSQGCCSCSCAPVLDAMAITETKFLYTTSFGKAIENNLEPIQFAIMIVYYLTNCIVWCVREALFAHNEKEGFMKDYDWYHNRDYMDCVAAIMVLNIFLFCVLSLIFLSPIASCRHLEERPRSWPILASSSAGSTLCFYLALMLYIALLIVDIGLVRSEHNGRFILQLFLDMTGYLLQILFWGTKISDTFWGKDSNNKASGSFSSFRMRDFLLLLLVILNFAFFVAIVVVNSTFEAAATISTAGKWQYLNAIIESMLAAFTLQLSLHFWDERAPTLSNTVKTTPAAYTVA
eukprot:m.34462 g.34462  ORF g.34462 m.34462 type:complete len:586 (-) comp9530_c0_seq1:63-1820(-)